MILKWEGSKPCLCHAFAGLLRCGIETKSAHAMNNLKSVIITWNVRLTSTEWRYVPPGTLPTVKRPG